jgi:putative ABC transport system substrate-binding protein
VIRRRHLIALISGAALWPFASRAQQPLKAARLGVLRFGTAAAFANRIEALRAGLRDLGYVEGKNLVIDSAGRIRSSSCGRWQPSWSR